MIFEPVPPTQRLLAAMAELLAAARSLSEDPTDLAAVSRRRWALRLAQRSLRELGGMDGVEADDRQRVHAIAERVTALDAITRRRAEACRDRLHHARAETARRQGEASSGLLDWAA